MNSAQLQAALDYAVEGSAVLDVATLTFSYVNAAAASLFGLAREELLAQGPQALARLGGPSLESLQRSCGDWIAQSPKPFVTTHEYRRTDGTRPWIETSGVAVQLEGAWTVVANLRDVTGHHEAVTRMRQLSAAFNAGPEAMLVIDPDAMEYVEVNEAAAALFGMTREEFLRAGLRRIFGLADWPVDSTRQLYRELIEKESAAPSIAHIPMGMLPHPGRNPGVVLEATRRAVNVEGRWLIVSVMRDVTARQALLRKLELLRAAVNRAPDAIVVIDPEAMEYVEVNESCARLFGMTREEMLAAGLRRIHTSPAARSA